MSFRILRSDHVGFAVGSLDDALRFWIDGLGAVLERTGEMGGEFLGEVTGAHGATVRMAVVSVAGQTIELLEYRNVQGEQDPLDHTILVSRILPSRSTTSTRS